MRLLRRLNETYQKVYRNRHLWSRNLRLTDAEYRLWDLFVALYDWDKKHNETYETIEATDCQIAKILDWSDSKSCRVRNNLLRKVKGYLKQIGRSSYKIQPIINEEEIAPMQNKDDQMQEKLAPMQENSIQQEPNSIVSYKDKYLIDTEDKYKSIKAVVNNLEEKIKNRWLSDNIEDKLLVEEHQKLANSLLSYEINNDLLPL
jgi:hypothetical protein